MGTMTNIAKSVDYSKTTSEYCEYIRKRVPDMTAIIQMKTKNKICIGADSWNTNPDNHSIQKLFVNYENSIIVACAGENGKEYADGRKITIEEIVRNIIKTYDGNNIEIILQKLKISTKRFLEDLEVSESRQWIVVQYIVAYIKDGKVQSERLEIVKNRLYDKNNEVKYRIEVTDLSYFPFNPNINCFGKYYKEFTRAYMDLDIHEHDMHKQMQQLVAEQIDYDIKQAKNESERSVGGDVYCAILDVHGHLDTFINNKKQEF